MRVGIMGICFVLLLAVTLSLGLGSCGDDDGDAVVGSCSDMVGQEHACKDYLGQPPSDPAAECDEAEGTFSTMPCPTLDAKTYCTYVINGFKVRWTYYTDYPLSVQEIGVACDIANGTYSG